MSDSEHVGYVKALLGSLKHLPELPPNQRAVVSSGTIGITACLILSLSGIATGLTFGALGTVWGWLLASTSVVVGGGGTYASLRLVTSKLPDATALQTEDWPALPPAEGSSSAYGKLLISRIILDLPLEQECQHRVCVRLETLREAIQLSFSKHGHRHGTLRACVFLPDISRTDTDQLFHLAIPTGFHIGMDNFTDRLIRFRPKRGLVGMVYRQRGSSFASRSTENNSEWVGGYELSEEEAGLVDPRVQWVIGWPVHTADRQIYGVVCVDGLDVPVDKHALYAAMVDGGGKASAVSAELASVVHRELVVTVNSPPNAV